MIAPRAVRHLIAIIVGRIALQNVQYAFLQGLLGRLIAATDSRLVEVEVVLNQRVVHLAAYTRPSNQRT